MCTSLGPSGKTRMVPAVEWRTVDQRIYLKIISFRNTSVCVSSSLWFCVVFQFSMILVLLSQIFFNFTPKKTQRILLFFREITGKSTPDLPVETHQTDPDSIHFTADEMPLRLITWNIHVSFSAPQTPKRDEKDWVDICFFSSFQWMVYLLEKYFTKLSRFKFHMSPIVASWNWSYLGTKERFFEKSGAVSCKENFPILNFPLRWMFFSMLGPKLRATKIFSDKTLRRGPAEVAKCCVCRATFFRTQPGLVARLYNKAQPKGKSTAVAPGTIGRATWVTLFFWALKHSNTVFGWDMQRLVPSPLKQKIHSQEPSFKF